MSQPEASSGRIVGIYGYPGGEGYLRKTARAHTQLIQPGIYLYWHHPSLEPLQEGVLLIQNLRYGE